MNREKLLRFMLGGSILIVFFVAIQFIFFIDQFPNTATAWGLSVREIIFNDASVITNNSFGWIVFLIAFNVLTVGLAFFFIKPNNKKLLELSVYNLALAVLFLVALYLFVNMFPENITGSIENGFLFSKFTYEQEPQRATNLMYLLTFLYIGLNVTFLTLKDEK